MLAQRFACGDKLRSKRICGSLCCYPGCFFGTRVLSNSFEFQDEAFLARMGGSGRSQLFHCNGE